VIDGAAARRRKMGLGMAVLSIGLCVIGALLADGLRSCALMTGS